MTCFSSVDEFLDAVTASAQGFDTAWIGAEHSTASAVRRRLLSDGYLHPDDVHASAYWTAGREWDHAFEASLPAFVAARAAGRDVTDPAVLQALAFEYGR
ncbi:SIP domain-containing protein [Paenarthrobacter sp. NPDC091669]|uniref:SIP domain-containing protein n=1 Tax=Paenarthrobacter sp. NPDC091669 TaxID=3364384 RepID=UPI0038109CE4